MQNSYRTQKSKFCYEKKSGSLFNLKDFTRVCMLGVLAFGTKFRLGMAIFTQNITYISVDV